MSQLIGPDPDEWIDCDFCGKHQPRSNRNCEVCNKALPLPPIRFSDQLPAPLFAKALGWTSFLLVIPALFWASLFGLDTTMWGFFVGVWGVGTLLDWIVDFRSQDNEAAALDTPEFSGSFYNPGALIFFAFRFWTFPMHAVRISWVRFWHSLGDE